eukprot:scaffold317694_cov28-Tisochrysis_lutea.AAC.1
MGGRDPAEASDRGRGEDNPISLASQTRGAAVLVREFCSRMRGRMSSVEYYVSGRLPLRSFGGRFRNFWNVLVAISDGATSPTDQRSSSMAQV